MQINRMEEWRKKALRYFPDLKDDLLDSAFSIYDLFLELLPMSRECHDEGSDIVVDKIYEFSDWCRIQKDKEIWNAAGLVFYASLFNDKRYWDAVLSKISLEALVDHWGLYLIYFEQNELKELKERAEKNYGCKLSVDLVEPAPQISHHKFEYGGGI